MWYFLLCKIVVSPSTVTSRQRSWADSLFRKRKRRSRRNSFDVPLIHPVYHMEQTNLTTIGAYGKVEGMNAELINERSLAT